MGRNINRKVLFKLDLEVCVGLFLSEEEKRTPKRSKNGRCREKSQSLGIQETGRRSVLLECRILGVYGTAGWGLRQSVLDYGKP